MVAALLLALGFALLGGQGSSAVVDTILIINGSESKYLMISTAERSELTISNLHINSDPDTYVGPGEDDTARPRLHLAALWPFLGIVAEVLVLVTIIFIYEKRWKPEQTLDENDPGAVPLKGIT
ncbi:hypothetical protein ACRRTK_009518 [Alexandromys fortis]